MFFELTKSQMFKRTARVKVINELAKVLQGSQLFVRPKVVC